MLEVFNRRNTVILALMQVGVVVIGSLMVEQQLRISEEMLEGQGLPGITVITGAIGAWLLLIPLAWIAAVSYCDYSKGTSRDLRTLILIAGILILTALIVLFIWATLAPYINILHGIDAD